MSSAAATKRKPSSASRLVGAPGRHPEAEDRRSLELELPLRLSIEPLVSSQTISQTAQPSETEAVDDLRIVVVDDEPRQTEMLREILGSDGHEVFAFNDARRAIDWLKQESCDLIMTDLGMPDINGWMVAKEAKALYPDLPIAVVTGWGSQVNEQQLRDGQADFLLSKPFELRELREVVAKVAAQRQKTTTSDVSGRG